MYILLKVSSLGESVASDFQLTSDFGLVSPNIITRSQLLDGVAVLVDNNAMSVTVSSTDSTCSVSKTVFITSRCNSENIMDNVFVKEEE